MRERRQLVGGGEPPCPVALAVARRRPPALQRAFAECFELADCSESRAEFAECVGRRNCLLVGRGRQFEELFAQRLEHAFSSGLVAVQRSRQALNARGLQAHPVTVGCDAGKQFERLCSKSLRVCVRSESQEAFGESHQRERRVEFVRVSRLEERADANQQCRAACDVRVGDEQSSRAGQRQDKAHHFAVARHRFDDCEQSVVLAQELGLGARRACEASENRERRSDLWFGGGQFSAADFEQARKVLRRVVRATRKPARARDVVEQRDRIRGLAVEVLACEFERAFEVGQRLVRFAYREVGVAHRCADAGLFLCVRSEARRNRRGETVEDRAHRRAGFSRSRVQVEQHEILELQLRRCARELPHRARMRGGARRLRLLRLEHPVAETRDRAQHRHQRQRSADGDRATTREELAQHIGGSRRHRRQRLVAAETLQVES